jgi:hypothetical protein
MTNSLISLLKAEKFLRKGHKSFLLYMISENEEKKIKDVPVVAEFKDVFLEDLPGLPPPRQVKFRIDLQPETTPIAKAPYRLAPSEMQELMEQIQDLLEKGLIRPNSPPWGAPMLFMKRKDGSMRMCIDY